jgi:Icc-related predicted phosphoesterase
MVTAQLIFIMGDIHGDWTSLNTYIDNRIRNSPQIEDYKVRYDELEIVILQAGDFGFWPHRTSMDIKIDNAVEGIKNNKIKIYWCDGNHENHDALDTLEAEQPNVPFIEVANSVYYATFGSILTLLDNTTVMFCGGADSIDKHQRKQGVTWWKQEVIDEHDMARLPSKGTRIDWIISHTCPNLFKVSNNPVAAELYDIDNDPSRYYLDKIFNTFKPRQWWFGHFHCQLRGSYRSCKWTALNTCDNGWGEWVQKLPVLVK